MASMYVNHIKTPKLVQRFGIELLSEWSGLLNGKRAHSGLQNLIPKLNMKEICRLHQWWVCLPSYWLWPLCAIQLQVHGSQAVLGTSWKAGYLCCPSKLWMVQDPDTFKTETSRWHSSWSQGWSPSELGSEHSLLGLWPWNLQRSGKHRALISPKILHSKEYIGLPLQVRTTKGWWKNQLFHLGHQSDPKGIIHNYRPAAPQLNLEIAFRCCSSNPLSQLLTLAPLWVIVFGSSTDLSYLWDSTGNNACPLWSFGFSRTQLLVNTKLYLKVLQGNSTRHPLH